ncbi:hypothetical protein ACWT_2938 [Actinoplanes sp. SE50]|uniref:hypothetical protein n=1 Tax=unclassified Actinoplanes TaxID=2626549 RepID=UPI00023EBEEC|nr:MULTISPECIES: hypothetical protein [unclassified Actinoplanes]AEV83504.1 hypothetical protein ACPL_2609 [Actinoplanes sp. SE50/110]ATO82353.1 hypothetical protein ACWT_2938 [Actinoplanes sp. SE50]SLL99760.1 uncharacterized protein ACSP50_2991 [Actinoplanes sp. SE50/110]
MTRLLAPVLLLTLVAACAAAPAGGSTPQVSGAPDRVFPLDFSRSGGFAGRSDRLHIDADGRMTVTRQGAGSSGPVAVDRTVLDALRQVLATADPIPSASSGICADGYRYRISTPSWSVSTDDCAEHHESLDRALELLVPLLRP